MGNIFQVGREFRQALLDREGQTGQQLSREYAKTYAGILSELQKVTKQIEDARRKGEPVRKSWLFKEQRLGKFTAQIEGQIGRFAGVADTLISAGQRASIDIAQHFTKELVRSELDGKARARVMGAWNRLPTEQVEAMVGTLRDGSPLRSLLDKLGPDASQRGREILTDAVVQGKNPRQTAKRMEKGMEITRTRALTIARTEQLRSARVATLDNYRENDDVVSGWIRIESLDDITCVICIEEHGRVYTLEDEFESHPNCRGTLIPNVAGVDRQVETGPEWFAKQDESFKLEVLGDEKYAAYDSGDISLSDLVQRTESEQWGGGRRERSLEEAQSAAEERRSEPEPEEKIEVDTSLAGADERWFEFYHASDVREFQREGDLKVGSTDGEGRERTKEAIAQIKSDAAVLQAEAEKTRNPEKTVYRGITYTDAEDLKTLYKKGETWKADALTSTATDKKIAKIYTDAEQFQGGEGKGALLEIQDPKGVVGYRVQESGGIEIILPQGAEYKIAGYRKDTDGQDIVSLMRVSKSAPKPDVVPEPKVEVKPEPKPVVDKAPKEVPEWKQEKLRLEAETGEKVYYDKNTGAYSWYDKSLGRTVTKGEAPVPTPAPEIPVVKPPATPKPVEPVKLPTSSPETPVLGKRSYKVNDDLTDRQNLERALGGSIPQFEQGMLYHTTPIKNLSKIAEQGLIPDAKKVFDRITSDDVYLATGKLAQYWAEGVMKVGHERGNAAVVMLRTARENAVGAIRQANTDVVARSVAKEYLEVWDGKKWVPLKKS